VAWSSVKKEHRDNFTFTLTVPKILIQIYLCAPQDTDFYKDTAKLKGEFIF